MSSSTSRADLFLKIQTDIAGLTEMARGIKEADSAFLSLAKKGASLAFGIGSVEQAVRGVKSAFQSTIVEGVRFNGVLESASFSLAGVLRQFRPDSFKTMDGAIAASADIIGRLKKEALLTKATFEELLVGYQGTAGAMFAAGVPLQKQVTLISNISQAMSALGIKNEELRQEATALLSGNIDRNARLAQTLGITRGQIETAREQGKVYEFVSEKLKAFSVSARAAADSKEVLESNLKDANTQATAEATVELTSAYKDLLTQLTSLVKSDSFKDTIGMLATAAKYAVQIVSGVTKAVADASNNSPGSITRRFDKDHNDIFDRLRSATSDEEVEKIKVDVKKKIKEVDDSIEAYYKERPGGSAIVREERERIKKYLQGALGFADYDKFREEVALRAKQASDEAAKAKALLQTQASDKNIEEERKKAIVGYESAQKASREEELRLLSVTERRVELEKDLLKLRGTPLKIAADFLASGDGTDPNSADRKEAQKAADSENARLRAEIYKREYEIKQLDKSVTDAGVNYLKVKAQAGTVDERIAALQAEKNALDSNALDYKAKALAIDQAILKIADDETAKVRARATEEAQLARQAEIQRIQDDKYLTDKERRAKLFIAFKREEAELEDRIAAAEMLARSQAEGSATRAQAESELKALRARRSVGLPHDLSTNQPETLADKVSASYAKMKSGFADIADVITNTTGAAINGLSNSLYNVFTRSQSLKQGIQSLFLGLGQSVLKAGTDMIAQWIIQHAIMDNVRRIFHASGVAQQAVATSTEVAIHGGGEAAKTGATGAGAFGRGVIRVGETIFHGIQVGFRVATHVAGEIAKTAITIVQAGIRIAFIIAESLAHVIKAGVQALGAFPIPFAGPILGLAAMAAVIAAGAGLVKGIKKGFLVGGYTGRGAYGEVAGEVHKNEWVANPGMVSSPISGPIIAGLEAYRQGKTSNPLAGIGGGASSAVAVGGSGLPPQVNLNLGFHGAYGDASSWARTQEGETFLVDMMRRKGAVFK